ncbi:hypothetical protein GGS24DRAFT_485120 [Hypoxylon argillaceum]|nr:hypothetical protein GGS24DRAFT_485120 [Hypoxylon argillaceum]
MQGDAADLMAILSWCDPFFYFDLEKVGDDNNDLEARRNYYRSAEVRATVGELCVDLVNAFENCEKECRKSHHLAGAKKAKANYLQTYEVFLTGRRALALAAWPHPGMDADDESAAAWKNAQLFRLFPTDLAVSA